MDKIDPELLKRYAEGRCTEEERIRAEEWLEQDDNLFEEEIDARPRKTLPVFKGALLLATIILLSGIGYVMLRRKPNLNALQTYEVPAGKRSQVTLPDSSTVWLAGGSSISYPRHFADSARTVRMNKGTAFFDIKRRPSQPFSVAVGELGIKVIGTSFNVEKAQSPSLIKVTLRDGSIRVQGPHGQNQLMKPGEQLIYQTTAHRVETVRPVNLDQVTAWTKGLLWFQETPATEVFQKLETTYGVHFQIGNPADLDMPITGKFNNLPLSRILYLLENSTPLHFEQHEKIIIIQP